MRNLVESLIFVFLFIFVYQTEVPGQEYQTDIYTIKDGLASSTVYDITQDSKGRIWFATRSGISVYDGIQWISYGKSDDIPSLNIFRIAVDEGMQKASVKPLRVELISNGRELVSTLLEQGETFLEDVGVGQYKIKIHKNGQIFGDIALKID